MCQRLNEISSGMHGAEAPERPVLHWSPYFLVMRAPIICRLRASAPWGSGIRPTHSFGTVTCASSTPRPSGDNPIISAYFGVAMSVPGNSPCAATAAARSCCSEPGKGAERTPSPSSYSWSASTSTSVWPTSPRTMCWWPNLSMTVSWTLQADRGLALFFLVHHAHLCLLKVALLISCWFGRGLICLSTFPSGAPHILSKTVGACCRRTKSAVGAR